MYVSTLSTKGMKEADKEVAEAVEEELENR